jgi:hypothetical protein
MMAWFEKVRQVFTPPSSLVIAARDLEESKRQLLKYQDSRELADNMCKYYEQKIKRLTNYLASNETQKG